MTAVIRADRRKYAPTAAAAMASQNEALVACICTPNQGMPEQLGPVVCSSTPQNLMTNCGNSCKLLFPEPPSGVGLADAEITDDLCVEGADSTGDEGSSCVAWDPANELTIDLGGVAHLDATFMADLIEDPSPLRDCDDASFSGLSATGFELLNADTGEFAYELGLRDRDVPLTLNGLPLDDYSDVLDAYMQLYVQGGATRYTLEVKRGVNIVTFEYELDP